MKEITRIHIAKTSYDIEIVAKKDLEKYLQKLELYADNQDWFDDIEIRITEILSERGVKQNGVISSSDITAIRQQLGDPKDFVGDGDIAIGLDSNKDDSRRLYRNPDNAVLGGVLGGIASYLGVNPLWTRIGFIILLFVSFGTAFILYLVLWLVLPEARTAAEKLQLYGRPVTAATIKEFREEERTKKRVPTAAPILQNILAYGFGTLAAISSLAALIATAWGGVGFTLGIGSSWVGYQLPNTWEMWTAYILFIASGLLLSALFVVLTYVLFKKKLTKRTGVAIVAIILSGIAVFSAGLGAVSYVTWQEAGRVESSRFTRNVSLPEHFSKIDKLVIDTSDGNSLDGFMAATLRVEYIVSPDRPRYELTLDSTNARLSPKIAYSAEGVATITVAGAKTPLSQFYSQSPVIKIYGPAIQSIKAISGSIIYTNNNSQDELTIEADKNSSVELVGSYIGVSAATIDSANVDLSGASIESLAVNLRGGEVRAGVVRNLSVTHDDVCPIDRGYGEDSTLNVGSISSGRFSYNGVDRPATSVHSPCGNVIIDSEDE